jgi:hypothetical protein
VSEHVPTTEEIRSSYPLSDADRVTMPDLAWDKIITVEAFDRWLAAHVREKQAEALEQAARRTGDLVLKHDLARMAAEYRNTGNTEGTN